MQMIDTDLTAILGSVEALEDISNTVYSINLYGNHLDKPNKP